MKEKEEEEWRRKNEWRRKKTNDGRKKPRKQLTMMTNFNVVSRERETKEGRKEGGHRGVREGRRQGGEREVEGKPKKFKTVYEATNTQFIGF